MIVSGLPPTEGDQHATQIARMALNLMGNASRFDILIDFVRKQG